MYRIIWLGSIALLCSPLTALSQVPGSRVRVTELNTDGFRRHSGTVVRAGADSVVLRLDHGGAIRVFSLAGLSRFEVSRERKGHTGTGATLGLLAGIGVGVLISTGRSCGSDCSDYDDTQGLIRFIWASTGGAIGLVAGALVGSSVKTDKWEALPSGRWHVSARLVGKSRFGLVLSLRF